MDRSCSMPVTIENLATKTALAKCKIVIPMPVANLKSKRVLLDAIIDPCLCNLVVWVEVDADEWSLHIAAACRSCRELALQIAQKALGKLPPVTFEDG